MATASYTTDLTDITTAESTTGWTALGGGASGLGTGADFSMQGTLCVDKQVTAAEKGQVYDPGANVTIASGRHVFTWLFLATPGLADTLAARGLTVAIGSSTTAYCKYHVEGNDTYGAAGRVARCYPVDPSVYSSNTGSSPYRTQVGTPSGAYRVFGGLTNITGTVKGANLGVDAIRHGTGVFITAGDVSPNGPATFSGLATENDKNTTGAFNRWGVFTRVSGGYELQGALSIGYDNAGTETACYMVDSNVSITIPNNVHVSTGFNKILFGHASTDVTWTNVSITSLCTISPGGLNVSANDPTIAFNNCTFSGLGSILLRPSTTATGCTFRLCESVSIINGGVLDTCRFDSAVQTAVVMDVTQLGNLTDCTFVSDGTGHAVDLDTVTSTTSVNWNNFLSGYVTGTTGSPVTTGTSGNEAIRVTVNSGQTLTINVGTGYTIPSVKNDGTGTVNVVAGQVTTTIKVTTTAGANIQNARVYLIAGSGGPLTAGTVIFNTLTDANGEVSDIRSLASNQPVTGWVRKGTSAPYYKTSQINATIDNAAGLSLTVLMIPDE